MDKDKNLILEDEEVKRALDLLHSKGVTFEEVQIAYTYLENSNKNREETKITFDYGKKLSDRQHEHHPINTNGEFVAPIRNSYIHNKCGEKTFCGDAIAETYAKNPNYYSRTFCSQCHDYFPIFQFKWSVDNVQLGEIGGIAGKDLKESWGKY